MRRAQSQGTNCVILSGARLRAQSKDRNAAVEGRPCVILSGGTPRHARLTQSKDWRAA